MVFTLKTTDLLRLRLAAGSLVAVLRGRVWVTEPQRDGDRLLEPGQVYRVAGNGLVLVGTDVDAGSDGAEIALEPPWRSGPVRQAFRAFLAWLNRRRTAHELEGLSDRMLRDIGLRREQIAAATRISPRRDALL